MRIASSSLAGFIFPSQSASNGEKMRNGVSSLPPSARFPLWEKAFNGCKHLGSIFPSSQTHVDSEVCPRLSPNWPPLQERLSPSLASFLLLARFTISGVGGAPSLVGPPLTPPSAWRTGPTRRRRRRCHMAAGVCLLVVSQPAAMFSRCSESNP